VDEKELTADVTRLHKLVSRAAEEAKEQGCSRTLLDKLTSAQVLAELLLRKIRAASKP
jgi:hypothetical protein